MAAAAGDTPRRYTSPDEDSARWGGFEFRDGDVVVSTRSKHGTTWVQTIVLLLIHQRDELPAPLGELAPWLDHLAEPLPVVLERLAAQQHRRVIKTHTPLDGVPLDGRATYIVVARNPLDAAVSLYHQGDNIDHERLRALTGAPPGPPRARVPLDVWLRGWIEEVADPLLDLDSLQGVLWHLSDAWRRRHDPNVVLVHYDDLLADLEGEMRRLADVLGINVAAPQWDGLVAAARLDAMRARADALAPDAAGILRDRQAFFRRGGSGAGAEVLDAEALRRYEDRVSALAPPDLLAWLHR